MLRWPLLLAVYGILNAAAYSCLMPLWEGWDEAYHYGYVQLLSTTRQLPVLGKSTLTREIWHSLELAPVSHYLQPFLKAPLNFAQYFALSPAERKTRQKQLRTLPVSEKYELQTDKPNYEVMQSPLPYFFMAPFDFWLAGSSLTTRILALRLVCSLLTVLLILHSTLVLARRLLPERYACAALFCIFSSQMLYATICHVGNDWLAIPLMSYVLCTAILTLERGSRRDCFWLGLTTSAALLTKAYFLFLVPFAIGVMLVALSRRRATFTAAALFLMPLIVLAGPWYLRNLILYHNVGGTVEQTAGLEFTSFLQSMAALPWRESIVYMAHSGLWTGNNSFTTFSAITIDMVLAVLGAGLALNFASKPREAELMIWSAVLLFALGLAFISVSYFIATKGQAIAAAPWHSQVLLSPLVVLSFLGLSRAQFLAPALFRVFVCLWCYVLVATYLVKLAPLYGGYPVSRTRFGELWTWYTSQGGEWSASLGDPVATWTLIAFAIVLSLGLCSRLALTPP